MTTPVAIITGAASGIGAAMTRRLAQDAWALAINYRTNQTGAEQVAAECETEGAEVLTIQGDVSIDADCRRMVASVLERWGRVDALVNSAGTTVFCPPQELEGLNRADFERIFSVNVIGVFQMIRACVPALTTSRQGAVLNVSSHAGFSGLGSSMAYAASKAALNNLTLAMARSLAPSVRVNAVCPGFVDTRWVRGTMDEHTYARFKDHIADMTPLGRMTDAAEIAESALHLITAPSITGQLLVVDGGNHLTVNAPDFEG